MGELKEPFLTLFEVKYDMNIEINDSDLKKMA